MPYFCVDVTSQVVRTYLIEASNSGAAEALARKATVEGRSAEKVHKIKEAVKTNVEVDRLPDDGDIYNSEIKNELGGW